MRVAANDQTAIDACGVQLRLKGLDPVSDIGPCVIVHARQDVRRASDDAQRPRMPTFGPSPRRFQGQGTRRLPQGLYGSEDQTTTLTSAFCTGRGLRKNPDLPSITGNVDPIRLNSFPVPVLHALTVNGTPIARPFQWAAKVIFPRG